MGCGPTSSGRLNPELEVPDRGAVSASKEGLRVTLVYNEKSGAAFASEEELVRALFEIGWKVERRVSRVELAYDAFRDVDAVVAAGGDGTIARVAKQLAGTGVPLAIIPMGTANNVARSLGVGVDPRAALAGLADAVERRVDLGIVESQLERAHFLEGFGVGIFAHVVAERASKHDKKLHKALNLIADELEHFEPPYFELEVDGHDLSGAYLLAAVMNTQSLGPALAIAPAAKCDDGELDVVLVRPEAKRVLLGQLRRAAEEGVSSLPPFETVRATHVRLRADRRWAHIDDYARELAGYVTIDVVAEAVRLLAPASR